MADYPPGDPRWGFSEPRIPRGETEYIGPEEKHREPPPLWAKWIGGIILAFLFVGVVFPLLFLVGRLIGRGIIELWSLALS